MGRTTIVAGLVLSLLLMYIGSAANSRGTALVGSYLLPLVIFGGGILSTEQSTAVRVTMLVFGGLLLLMIGSPLF